MDALSRSLLGLIALASLVQAGFLAALVIAGRALGARLREIESRLEGQLAPSLHEMSRITRNVAELTEIMTDQGRRIDAVVADTADKVHTSTAYLREVVLQSAAPLVEVGAFWRGVRRGFAVLRGSGNGSRSHYGRPPRAPSERERRRDEWGEGQRPDLPVG